jgi:uncharacterized protein YacL
MTFLGQNEKSNLLFTGPTKLFINSTVHFFVISVFMTSEGFILWKNCKQQLSTQNDVTVVNNSGPVSIALILAFMFQTIIDVFIIPRLAETKLLYVTKIFVTTLLFFVFVPGLIVVRNESMRERLFCRIKLVLNYCNLTKTRVGPIL